MSGELDQLERLERLRTSGALTEAEFRQEKKRLLAADGGTFTPDWRSITRAAAFIIVAGVVIITVLLVMPAPKRAIDTAPSNAAAPAQAQSPTAVPQPIASTAPAAADEPVAQAVPEAAEGQGSMPAPVHGRCSLTIKGITYLNGACDIVLAEDGSFDVFEHFGQPGYFAKVIRDGAMAQGYWNGARDSDHAQDELGELTRSGACWKNATAKICAWS
ncbi:SHOCT domain-containing protein [Sphingomonas sp. JC676]|uniref:SHOCT domain-containing protein n=1 Tax=Sphingomonas sp. JC676 TaxID=2768065 RepID=UPI001657A2C0|nr:SHOCT domain-containing protein [Sphingomonas sp. JC676]MBC9032687.1 SHOCT domain-containing protein [Sphingomonas sp. JC676]